MDAGSDGGYFESLREYIMWAKPVEALIKSIDGRRHEVECFRAVISNAFASY
jgi:hypothetical protein